MIAKNGKYVGPLSAVGWLNLRNTQIKELPKGLSVGGNLHLDKHMFIPFIHKVGGEVWVKNTWQKWLITNESKCFVENRGRFLWEVR